MFLGAVCEREVLVAPRARGLFVARAVYAGTLLGIIATCWLLVSGTRPITTVGDTARFGGTLLRILGPLQLALAMMSAALTSVVAVGVEKDRKTLELLLVSRLDDAQLVLGKLAGSLLRTGLLLVAAVPVFALATAFGGATPAQMARAFVVTAAAAATAAAVANAIAFWRDTTFQSLAITLFAIVAWLAAGESPANRPRTGEIAAAASPPLASSADPARPVRISEVTTRRLPTVERARRRAPAVDPTDAPMSNAGTSAGRRNAAWIAVALVLSA